MQLKIDSMCGTIRVEQNRAICPSCGRKLFPALWPDTAGRNIPLFCKGCKTTLKVNIQCQSQSARAH